MIPINTGVALLAHLTIILAAKTKKFYAENSRNIPKKSQYNSLKNRLFNSLAIAVIVEFMLLLSIIVPFGILKAGISSERSNYNVIKSAFENIKTQYPPHYYIFQEEETEQKKDSSALWTS